MNFNLTNFCCGIESELGEDEIRTNKTCYNQRHANPTDYSSM